MKKCIQLKFQRGRIFNFRMHFGPEKTEKQTDNESKFIIKAYNKFTIFFFLIFLLACVKLITMYLSQNFTFRGYF